MTTNAKQIVEWVKENYPHVCSHFLKHPEKYKDHLIKKVADWLKERDQLYSHNGYESWERAMINQIKEWGITQLDSTQPEEHSSKKLSSSSTVEEDTKPKQNKHKDMSKYSALPVAKVTLVFGTDVSELGPQALIATISANNKQIKDLRETGITSPYIEQQIQGLTEANAALVAQLDTFAS